VAELPMVGAAATAHGVRRVVEVHPQGSVPSAFHSHP
jgi:hypothetical protein